MGKPSKGGGGFSAGQSNPNKRERGPTSSATQTSKHERALVLINQGKLQEAEEIYEELISAGTKNQEIYANLATIYLIQSRPDKSIPLFQKALHLKPDDIAAHNNLGIALKKQGALTSAIASYNKALELNPNYTDAYNNLGNALREKGDLAEAIASYNKALELNPNYTDAHNNLGIALKELGDVGAAIASYNKALELNPNYTDAHFNLGNAFQDQGEFTAAISSYNTALRLKPNDPETHNNLGNALREQGELNAAITAYNRALQLNPNNPETLNNLGTALKEQGELNAAITAYNRALELNPNYTDAHWNASLTMLLAGDYKNGWEHYEWRSKKEKNVLKPHALPKCRQSIGEVALRTTSSLLVVSEQGLGDTLQFMRYALFLKGQCAAVSLCAQTKLHSLIQTSGIDPSPLSPQQANQVSKGQWIPLLSLPKHLGVSPDEPIISKPYIKTTEELTAKWSDILGPKEKPFVGINWQGNPEAEKTGLRGRSLALETFSPIAASCQISLVSLQKGFGSEQLATCSFKDQFVSCQDQINETWDFLETAAIIANCDLVITSDSSVAHLAGGMGKTTWLLLHKVPDWRWGLEGDTTFWYPSVRLFRQRERGNWDEVMRRVAEALHNYRANSTLTKVETISQPAIKSNFIQNILAPVSLGELLDRITILQIKAQHLQGTALENVKKELEALETTMNDLQLNIDPKLIQRLKKVNQDLWQIEDHIRDQERKKNFGQSFIRLARSVYQRNDQRAAIKKEINITYGSALVEEKSYQQY